jgi:hypothetical protein
LHGEPNDDEENGCADQHEPELPDIRLAYDVALWCIRLVFRQATHFYASSYRLLVVVAHLGFAHAEFLRGNVHRGRGGRSRRLHSTFSAKVNGFLYLKFFVVFLPPLLRKRTKTP